eukprot:jgi/Picre1/35888/NNA_003347.t1
MRTEPYIGTIDERDTGPCPANGTLPISQDVGPVQLAGEKRRTVWIREFGWSHVTHLPSFEVILMTR